jgi:hypothetical protein
MTTDRSAVPKPPCPTCGTALTIRWADVTTFASARAEYVPTGLSCPVNEDHDTRAALGELDWPATLSDEDRVWMRRYGTLPSEV